MRRLLLTGLLLVSGGIAVAHEVTPKIYGGSDARQGDWPWMAYVALVAPGYGTQFCGGVLIAPDILLSAAHCVFPGVTGTEKITRIYASLDPFPLPSTNNLNTFDTYSLESIEENKIIPHSAYPEGTGIYINDIVIIRLDNPLQPDRFPVLASPQDISLLESLRASARNDVLTAIGWGETENIQSPFPERLQQVRLDYIPRTTCSTQWRSNPAVNITNGMVCAAEPNPGTPSGRDTCRGDSGGPLIWGSPLSPTVIGLTSFGNVCGAGVPPGVYTSLAHYIGWIEEKAAMLGSPLVDVSAVLPTTLRSGIGTTTTLSWTIRNNSLHTGADHVAFSINVPAGMNIDNISGADCVQSGHTVQCDVIETLAPGDAQTVSFDISHLTDSELRDLITISVTQDQFDYRSHNNSGNVAVTFTDRRPSSSSGGAALYLLPLLLGLRWRKLSVSQVINSSASAIGAR